jgi:hypothetical protein
MEHSLQTGAKLIVYRVLLFFCWGGGGVEKIKEDEKSRACGMYDNQREIRAGFGE